MMKNHLRFIASILFIFAFLPMSMASRSEQVRMVKADLDEHDLIIEKQDGKRWLIQHNRSCTSMSTEFPLTIIENENDDDQLKVSFNEICKINYAAPYGGEGKILSLIQSKNLIIPDHEARIYYKGAEHLIDYKGKDCNRLYEYVDQRVYYTFDDKNPDQGLIVLPGSGGQCSFNFKESHKVDTSVTVTKKGIKGLDYQAQNNQVYLYWNHDTTQEKPLYALSYSRHELNTDDYNSWREMPKGRLIRGNSYTVRNLANKQNYHFYLTVLDENLEVGEWTHIELTPEAPVNKYANQPIEGEEEKFEVKLEETDDSFRLYWNDDSFAKRYFIRFYVNGKEELFKINKPDVTEWIIPKQADYLGKGLRFTVRTLPKETFGPSNKDGIYWKYEE